MFSDAIASLAQSTLDDDVVVAAITALWGRQKRAAHPVPDAARAAIARYHTEQCGGDAWHMRAALRACNKRMIALMSEIVHGSRERLVEMHKALVQEVSRVAAYVAGARNWPAAWFHPVELPGCAVRVEVPAEKWCELCHGGPGVLWTAYRQQLFSRDHADPATLCACTLSAARCSGLAVGDGNAIMVQVLDHFATHDHSLPALAYKARVLQAALARATTQCAYIADDLVVAEKEDPRPSGQLTKAVDQLRVQLGTGAHRWQWTGGRAPEAFAFQSGG